MRISSGEMIRKYAAITKSSEAEVLGWVNAYVNSPEMFLRRDLIEHTEAERLASIKDYIERQIAERAN